MCTHAIVSPPTFSMEMICPVAHPWHERTKASTEKSAFSRIGQTYPHKFIPFT